MLLAMHVLSVDQSSRLGQEQEQARASLASTPTDGRFRHRAACERPTRSAAATTRDVSISSIRALGVPAPTSVRALLSRGTATLRSARLRVAPTPRRP
jgi:hypothetical protein